MDVFLNTLAASISLCSLTSFTPWKPACTSIRTFLPDGKSISEGASFNTRDQGNKSYTSKVSVNYEQGKASQVSFDWKQAAAFQMGDYKIEIYNNGFKIGEGITSLKKGGLF